MKTCLCVVVAVMASAAAQAHQLPADPFRPSNARTVDGLIIPVDDFIPAARCAGCHRDTYSAWSESLHRNAGREPFYNESVRLLTATRPIEFSRHCESCHLPVALLSGALKTGSLVSRHLDDEGVTCSVCHAITETTLDGTGSYTIARPAILVTADGRRLRDASDSAILADVEGHRRAVMRPLLRTAEFCAACHKSSVPPDLSDYPYLQKGFNVYDEWQQSPFSKEVASSSEPATGRAECRTCHMERSASTDDRASKGGTIASHRWRGANTAVPLFYGLPRQLEVTRQFLQSGLVDAEVVAIENGRTGKRLEIIQPTDGHRLEVAAGDPLSVEIVVSSDGIGHSFPPEIRDLYDAWVELEVSDRAGHSVTSTHSYRQVLVDVEARPLLRHEVWLAIARLCDDRLPPGTPDLLRLRAVLPPGFASSAPVRVRASVKYRRFNPEYTSYVQSRLGAPLEVPTIPMAERELVLNGKEPPPSGDSHVTARRWRRYGQALLARADRRASQAFARALALEPDNLELLIDSAAAELRTASSGPRKDHARRALALLAKPLAAAAVSPRARYWKALALVRIGEPLAAIGEWWQLLTTFPRDRDLRRRLANASLARGQWAEARSLFTSILQIDPLDGSAYQSLLAAALREGRDDLAEGYAQRYELLSHVANTSVEGSCAAR
jgi:hypothetical protein